MKIMMLLIGHDFPPDIRVEKESRALLAAGHQITLVCENRKGRPARENWNGVEILRLPRLPLGLRRINTTMLFTTTYSPLWEWHMKKLVRTVQPDALHVHDLPFVGPGLRIAEKFNLPLIADLHENYPALLQIRRDTTKNPLDAFIFAPQRFARCERQVLLRCDYVIVVVEEAAERVRALGVEAERIVVVGNTEDIEAIDQTDIAEIALPPSELRLLYVGGIGPHRGVDVAVRAMPTILESVPSATLVVVGDGTFRKQVERLTRALDLPRSAVRFEGYQPFSKVHSYIRASDICLVPHIANAHTNATMPHKLFQYMYMGKPVVVSTAIPLARVVRETRAGLVFESGEPASLAHCALQLHDPVARRRLGETGRQAVITRYNWRYDAQRLLALYNRLEARVTNPDLRD